MTTVYETIMRLLRAHTIPYREFVHAPIYSYEDANREQKIHGWDGVESKSVLMTDKKGGYALLATRAGIRVDFAEIRALHGAKLSLASGDEVRDIALCVPGNIPPFGFPIGLATYVDTGIFALPRYVFSPGVPDRTIEVEPARLRPIFERLSATLLDDMGVV